MNPLTILLLASVSLLPSVEAARTIYVSPSGNDANAGTQPDRAFQTITRARDEVRRMKAEGGAITVELLPGRYQLQEGIRFTAEDSGSAGAPVTYRSSEPRAAVLSGARTLRLADFSPVKDPSILARLDPAARGNVVSLDLRAAGLDHGGAFPDVFDDRGGIFEVFDASGRLPLSRWPNEGVTTMAKVIEVGDKKVPGIFEYRDDRPSRWLKNPEVWLKGQWRVGWEDPAIKVAAIDAEAKTITFAAGLPNGIGSKYQRPQGSGKEPWYAINLLEEIDRPGEWAIDFSSGTLYVWPRDPASDLTITQLDEPLITVDGTSDLVIEGLTLQHSLGDGIVMENVTRCLVAGCTVRDIAGRGIVLNGMESGVLSCDVSHVGEGAVLVSGGDRKSLTKSGNFVLNNHLHHYGLLKHQYSAAVHVGTTGNNAGGTALRDAVGIRVAHNVIHHGPRDAIFYSGNDNLYEFNDIYYCGYDTADVGAFYSWLDWTMRGNVIRYNFIHDTVGGVNPDDGASGNFVFGNVFAGPRVGVWIASGPDNVIRNNIFVKDEGSVFGMDDRGTSRGYASNGRLINRVLELNPGEEPWKSAHPELASMLENSPDRPWRTQFVGNLIVSKNPKPSEIKTKAALKNNPEILVEENNLTVETDPGFVNAAEKNFALRPDADVFQQIPGFEPIPFEKIGLYPDPYRPSLPDEKARQRGPEYSPFAEDKDLNFGT